MSVAGRDGTDGVDKLAKDAFIFSIFCAKKFPKSLASLTVSTRGNDTVLVSHNRDFVALKSYLI